ncbi:NERD domain-containing protein, partial [bacterium]|nr:NERD domain-containing protein [bacterium]
MANMLPCDLGPETISPWERKLFYRFKEELPDNVYVIHSLKDRTHTDKRWGEADFVIVSTKGIYVIEVKGGGVSCKDGSWIYTDRKGNSYPKSESPWDQASKSMLSVQKEIESKNKNNKGFVYGYGVIMPDERSIPDSMEIIIDVLLDKDNLDKSMKDYLSVIEDYWVGEFRTKRKRVPRTISNREIIFIRKILRPDFDSTFTLKSRFDVAERQLIEWTKEQQETMKGLENNERSIITGAAGTGKTILAFDKAVSAARKGNSVLMLCFGELLADTLINNIPEDVNENLEIFSFFGYVTMKTSEYLEKKGDDFNNLLCEETRMKYDTLRQDLPELFCEAVLNDDDFKAYDMVIIDEAQDILCGKLPDVIDFILKGGLKFGNWHLFLDPNQASDFALRDINRILEQMKSYKPVFFNLSKNCRNCKQILDEAKKLTGYDFLNMNAIEGGKCDIIKYSSTEDFKTKYEMKLKEIYKLGYKSENIVVLSSHEYEKSIMFDAYPMDSYYDPEKGLQEFEKQYASKLNRINDLLDDTDYLIGPALPKLSKMYIEELAKPEYPLYYNSILNIIQKLVDYNTIDQFRGCEKDIVMYIDFKSELINLKQVPE